MDPRLLALLDAVLQRSREDTGLAAALRASAEAVLDHLNATALADSADGPHSAAPAVMLAAEAPADAPPAESDVDSDRPSVDVTAEDRLEAEALARLHAWASGGAHGDGSDEEPAAPLRPWQSTTDAVLAPLAERFAAKATAARWRAEGADPGRKSGVRSQLAEAEADLTILDVAVVHDDPERWGHLADAFEAAGRGADVLSAFADAGRLLSPGSPFAEAVVAAAEAQSAVRTAHWALRGQRPERVPPKAEHDDPDQVALFRWLREATDLDGVYVERHMRWEDPADPAQAPDVDDRLQQIAHRAGVSLRAPRPTATARALKAAAYHARRLADRDWDAGHQRARLLDCVDAAVTVGVAPTDVRLREVLLPLADDLPAADDPDVPPRASRVLAAVYAYLFEQEERADIEAADEATPPEHVRMAADLLRGKRLALFGGVPRAAAIDALERALELASVEWVETRAHQSTASFEAVVARSDVAVQLIRFSSHSFADLREMCAEAGAVFVRAPRGYSPSAIAHAVLEQASRELRDRGPA